MATVNYKCPNCGGPLTFNPDKQQFSCEYCMSDFEEKFIQDLYAEKEAKESQAEKAEKKAQQNTEPAPEGEEEAVVYTCPSCGAEVVTTATTAATTCFYCQNPVVLGGRLSEEFKPDRIIPFALSKEKAIDTFLGMCKKKWFLPKAFTDRKRVEKIAGVYFPYWYVDEQKTAALTARGEKVRVWTTGKTEYTETSIYHIERAGDVIIKNVFERALKSEDRDMLQSVHPFDLTKAHKFSMSYLAGFRAEKRDLEKSDIEDAVEQRIKGYTEQVLKSTAEGYDSIQTESFEDKTELSAWTYNLLPVWVLTYKFGGKILPYAINGQTGKTYGLLPTSKGKLAICGAIIAAILFLIGTLGGMFFL